LISLTLHYIGKSDQNDDKLELNMNFYLDIDGTIITKDQQQAGGLKSFLTYLYKNGEIYWLTTHCKENNITKVFSYLEPILDKESFALIQKIKPTSWQTLKTESIDFSQPFIWFDDYILEAEKIILEKNNALDNWIKINLQKNHTLENYISKN
jgi:hypothetical protein